MVEPARNADGLPSLYGYAALERIYGWKRRTLENAMRKGQLSRPTYHGKRAYWEAVQIDDYLRRLRGELARQAVSTPDDIAPERIDHALDVLAERWATARGLDLPAGTYLSLNTPLTDEQQAALQRSAAQEREESVRMLTDAFAQLDHIRGSLVVAGLIPALRPVVDRILENAMGQRPSETQDELRALALDILDQAIGGELVGPS